MSTSVFQKLVEVIAALRQPVTGCPWDLEQTHLTLRPYLLEETYEALEAIDSGSDKAMKEELGDVLLQVVLHAQIAGERNAFSIEDIVTGVTEKMIRRHPHVFGEVQVADSSEVLKNWEQLKQVERSGEAKKSSSVLDGVPTALPGLVRAQRIGEKASRISFDWNEISGVWKKVEEEIGELKAEVSRLPQSLNKPLTTAPSDRSPELQAALESELGDLLFSVSQYARWLGVSAEDALRGSTQRFIERFQSMERTSPRPLSELSDAELDAAWELAKAALKRSRAR